MAHPARILAAVILAAGPVLATDQADATDASGSAAAATSPSGSWTVTRAQTIRNSNLILNSVTVPAVGDVWAVGYRYGTVGGATEFRTVIERSTSTGDFQLVPSPDREGAPAVNFLQDISGSSPTDLWTVGWSRDPAQRSHTLIEHGDGTSWTFATSPDPGPYGDILQGVTSIAADDAWAVGA